MSDFPTEQNGCEQGGHPKVTALCTRVGSRRNGYGVYQIGDVYARSCVIIGTSSGRLIPNLTCS